MAGNASDYTEDKLGRWIAGSNNMPSIGTRYIGLFSSDPTDANVGTEVTEDIREDGRLAFVATTPVNGVFSNASELDFGISPIDVLVTHVGIYDAATAGNLLVTMPLQTAKNIQTADTVIFDAGSLEISID